MSLLVGPKVEVGWCPIAIGKAGTRQGMVRRMHQGQVKGVGASGEGAMIGIFDGEPIGAWGHLEDAIRGC